jgi:hypothetical protein
MPMLFGTLSISTHYSGLAARSRRPSAAPRIRVSTCQETARSRRLVREPAR